MWQGTRGAKNKSWFLLIRNSVEVIECDRSHDTEHHGVPCAWPTLLGGLEQSTEGLASALPFNSEK